MDTIASPTASRPRVRRAIVAVAVTLALITLAGGCGDDSPGADLPAVEGPVSPRIEVTAHEMGFAPDAIAVEAGEVGVVLHNDGSILHDLRIEDQPSSSRPGRARPPPATSRWNRAATSCSAPSPATVTPA